MKKNAVKDFMLSNVTQAIIGLIIALVGIYFLYFSKNETLLESAPTMGFFGLIIFMMSTHQVLEKKKNLRKLSQKLNPDNTSKNTDAILDALDGKISVQDTNNETNEKPVTPKERRQGVYVTLLLTLVIVILILLISIDSKLSIFGVLLVDMLCIIIVVRSVYILKTLRNYNKQYFKEKYIQPVSNDDTVLKQQIDSYISGLAEYEDEKPISYLLLIVIVLLITIGLVIINLHSFIL